MLRFFLSVFNCRIPLFSQSLLSNSTHETAYLRGTFLGKFSDMHNVMQVRVENVMKCISYLSRAYRKPPPHFLINFERISHVEIMAASHLNFSLMDTDTRTVSDFALSRSSLYSLVLLLSVTWLVTAAAFKRLKPATQVAISLGFAKPIARDTGASIKHPVRPPGVWQPIDFQRPAAAPYPNWDFHKTAPIPYRPFKYGPHYITMGLRTMKWDEWIELDNQFLEWHAIKVQRIQERGVQCCRTAPEAYDGAVELLEELLVSFISSNYLKTLRMPTLTHCP